MQTLYQAGDPQYKHFVKFTEDVAEMTGGRLAIQPFTVSAVVPAGGTLDAVKAGVLDGHFSYAGIWSGLEPGFAAMADLSGAYENEDQVLQYFYGFGGLDLLREPGMLPEDGGRRAWSLCPGCGTRRRVL